MILGLGTDIAEVARIAKSIAKEGFKERIFSEGEIVYCEKQKNKEENYTARFAAKEACAKALGTGLNHGVYWRDMGVVNLPGSKPSLKLTGGALARLKAMTPPGHRAQIDLSVTDDYPMAQAIVIISAVPEN